ncbi:MAG TPA: alkaline phosphatase D family protein [Solirubrobacteraceae bacterium]|nr:alkaline phosphatase D family protein [Solirubrobacteraceae bacterium]
MRRITVAAALAAALTLSLPAAASAAFSLGVAAGDITTNSAVLWAHATATGRATVQVATDRRFANVVATSSAPATRTRDLTVQVEVDRLLPGRTYYYRWAQGRARSAVGRFETAPRRTANATVSFAFSGDADATPKVGTRGPFYNRFQVYRRMMLERNDFNVNLGDTIYSDSDGVLGNTTIARTVAQKWAKYRRNIGTTALSRLRGATGFYSHWDDHEFINDFSIPEDGRALYSRGVKAFRDYSPVTYTSSDGLYRSFRWGRNVEVFMLDERSFRSAKASQGTECNNPQTGRPDEAPTAPPEKRQLFEVVYPPMSQPVSQACKDRINDPSRTFLGQRQFQRFTRAVRGSGARWKVVLNEVPISQIYYRPYDRWEGYADERRRLLESLRNVRNVVWLTTDVHTVGIMDVRFQTFEPGGAIDTGMDEFIAGPVATQTFADEFTDVTGNPGAIDLFSSVLVKEPPPTGLGSPCFNPDVFSYAQVKVTNTAFTVTAKDMNGRVVVDSTDRRTPCVMSLRLL